MWEIDQSQDRSIRSSRLLSEADPGARLSGIFCLEMTASGAR